MEQLGISQLRRFDLFSLLWKKDYPLAHLAVNKGPQSTMLMKEGIRMNQSSRTDQDLSTDKSLTTTVASSDATHTVSSGNSEPVNNINTATCHTVGSNLHMLPRSTVSGEHHFLSLYECDQLSTQWCGSCGVSDSTMGEEVEKKAVEKEESKKVAEEDEKKTTEESKAPPPPPPPPQEIVLRVYMHCEGCAKKVRKCLKGFQGAESASVDMKSSQVTVKGGFEASKLVEYLYKKTGKHAVIMKTEPEVKEEETVVENEEENNKEISEEGDAKKEKVENEEQKEQEEKKSKEENQELAKAKAEEGAKTEKEEREGETEVVAVADLLRAHELYHHPVHLTLNQFNAPPYHHPIQFNTEYVYPPQMFSDENPNACSVM
ncbi:hypothetical protein Sjap_016548 [Stephania japonica]|uniref:HMA domain-containing protein n=1 Tax=Stephania japonica TaxID=461633 RepID=A0AAP0IMU4_9MAGN